MAVAGTEAEVSNAFRSQTTITARPHRQYVIPAPRRLAIPPGDWETLVATHANTVVVGSEHAALGLWTAVWPALQKPIYWVDAGRLSLPRQPAGTLILQGAHTLDDSAQRQVCDWLDRDARVTRILTTTPYSLFPLVENGSFLTTLYYRLNMLLLNL